MAFKIHIIVNVFYYINIYLTKIEKKIKMMYVEFGND